MIHNIVDFLVENILGIIPIVISLLAIFIRGYLSEFRTELDTVLETKSSRLKADFVRALLIGFLITFSVSFVGMNDYDVSIGLGYVLLVIVCGLMAFFFQFFLRAYLLMGKERFGKTKERFNRVVKLLASFNFLLWFSAVFILAMIIDYQQLDTPEFILLIISLLIFNTVFIIISVIIATLSTTTRLAFKIENIPSDQVDEMLKKLYIVVFLDEERVLMSAKKQENIYVSSKPYYIYYSSSHRLQNIYQERGARIRNIRSFARNIR